MESIWDDEVVTSAQPTQHGWGAPGSPAPASSTNSNSNANVGAIGTAAPFAPLAVGSTIAPKTDLIAKVRFRLIAEEFTIPSELAASCPPGSSVVVLAGAKGERLGTLVSSSPASPGANMPANRVLRLATEEDATALQEKFGEFVPPGGGRNDSPATEADDSPHDSYAEAMAALRAMQPSASADPNGYYAAAMQQQQQQQEPTTWVSRVKFRFRTELYIVDQEVAVMAPPGTMVSVEADTGEDVGVIGDTVPLMPGQQMPKRRVLRVFQPHGLNLGLDDDTVPMVPSASAKSPPMNFTAPAPAVVPLHHHHHQHQPSSEPSGRPQAGSRSPPQDGPTVPVVPAPKAAPAPTKALSGGSRSFFPPSSSMLIVKLKFRYRKEEALITPELANQCPAGTLLVIQGDRGDEAGTVTEIYEPTSGGGDPPPPTRQALRLANQREFNTVQDLNAMADQAIGRIKAVVAEEAVTDPTLADMDVVDCEFQLDRKKLFVHYQAPMRLAIRHLTERLFRDFHCRVWMNQINYADAIPPMVDGISRPPFAKKANRGRSGGADIDAGKTNGNGGMAPSSSVNASGPSNRRRPQVAKH